MEKKGARRIPPEGVVMTLEGFCKTYGDTTPSTSVSSSGSIEERWEEWPDEYFEAELDRPQGELLLAEENRSPNPPGFERLCHKVDYRRGYVAGSSEERKCRAATITQHPSSYREVTGGRIVLLEDSKRLAPRTPSSQLIYKTSSPGTDRGVHRPRRISLIRPDDVKIRAAAALWRSRERSVSRSQLRLTGYRSIGRHSHRHVVDINCTPRVPKKRPRSRIYDDGTHSQSRLRVMTRMPETSGPRVEDQSSNRQPSKWEHDSFSSLKTRGRRRSRSVSRDRSVSRSPFRLTEYRPISRRSSNDPNYSHRHGVDIYCTPRVPSSVIPHKRSRSRIYDDGTHSQKRQRAMTRMPETSGSRVEDQRLQRARSESCIRDSEPDVNVSRRDSTCVRLVRSPNLSVKDQETTPSQKSSLMSVFSDEIAKSIVKVLKETGAYDGMQEESNQLLNKRRALQDMTLRGFDNVCNSAVRGQEGLTFTEDDSIAGIDPMEEEALDEEDAFFQRKLNCSVNQFLKLTFQPSSSKNNDYPIERISDTVRRNRTTERISVIVRRNRLQNPRQVHYNKSRAVENTDASGPFPEQWLETAPSGNERNAKPSSQVGNLEDVQVPPPISDEDFEKRLLILRYQIQRRLLGSLPPALRRSKRTHVKFKSS